MVQVKRATYSKKPALANFTVNRDCSLLDYDAKYNDVLSCTTLRIQAAPQTS